MVQLDQMDLKDQLVNLETRVQIPRNPRERMDQMVYLVTMEKAEKQVN